MEFRAISDEREQLLAFVQEQREAVVRKSAGLTDEQARWKPAPTANSIVGLVNHLAHVEGRWTDAAILGGERVRDEIEFRPEMPLAEAVEKYKEAWAHTDEVVRAHELNTRGKGAAQVDVRWILLHLVEETARHAGHIDITRELIDGTTGD